MPVAARGWAVALLALCRPRAVIEASGTFITEQRVPGAVGWHPNFGAGGSVNCACRCARVRTLARSRTDSRVRAPRRRPGGPMCVISGGRARIEFPAPYCPTGYAPTGNWTSVELVADMGAPAGEMSGHAAPSGPKSQDGGWSWRAANCVTYTSCNGLEQVHQAFEKFASNVVGPALAASGPGRRASQSLPGPAAEA